ncbi:hypothetical protein ABK040_008019 [Willaertia magna]
MQKQTNLKLCFFFLFFLLSLSFSLHFIFLYYAYSNDNNGNLFPTLSHFLFDPLHIDTFRTFTKIENNSLQLNDNLNIFYNNNTLQNSLQNSLQNNNLKDIYIVPIFGYLYYHTDLELFNHLYLLQYENYKFYNTLHQFWKFYLKILFNFLYFIFNLEINIIKEIEFFFLRFSAPSDISIKINLLNKNLQNNFTINIVTDKFGYFYKEIYFNENDYKNLFCNKKFNKNLQWINYEAIIYNFTKVGHVMINCDKFTKKNKKIYSVISDIDDSIKITNVTNILQMIKNTFDPKFQPIPYMSIFYNNLQKKLQKNINFHYVSSSPYILYPKLESFIINNNFPIGSFHLRISHLENFTFFTMLKSSKITKPLQIKNIIKSFKKRKFILVGDSAENDASIYRQCVKEFKKQIIKIYIRCVNEKSCLLVERELSDLPKRKYQLFNDTNLPIF